MIAYAPQPGDFFLAQLVPGVGRFAVELGELLIGDASRYSHAGVILDDGQAIEAMPGGARIFDTGELAERRGLTTYSRWALTDYERSMIVRTARSLVGTPYSWEDYGSLALANFHIRPDWVVRNLRSSGHMICSQLAAFAYQFDLVPPELANGRPVQGTALGQVYVPSGRWMFTDQRWTGDVTPGDLTYVLYGPEGS